MRNRELTRRDFVRLTSTGIAVAAVGTPAFAGLMDTDSSLPQQHLLSSVFTRPPAESRPWCYWYWMNGNMTREGIRADLEGLAEVGIGGVLLFDIGILPDGPVVNRSPEWFDLVKFAISEAAKRNIKVTLNCPGWSGSGGPWITPELAMQEVTWSESTADGPREFSAPLPQPPTRLGCYRDAAVIAFPTPHGDDPLPLPQVVEMDGKPVPGAISALDEHAVLPAAQISQSPAIAPAAPTKVAEASANLPVKFDLLFPRAVEVRSLYMRVARESGPYQAELSVWDESQGSFQSVARFGSHPGGPFSTNMGRPVSLRFARIDSGWPS